MKDLTIYLQRADKYLKDQHTKALASKEKNAESLFNEKGEIYKEYPPYAASFGATVIRSGLLPAVFLYAEKDGKGKNKAPLSELFYHIVDDGAERANKSLKDHVLEAYEKNPDRIRQQLLDASIAAKLVMRTFTIEEKTEQS